MATDDSLYPELDDTDFNQKIALKKRISSASICRF